MYPICVSYIYLHLSRSKGKCLVCPCPPIGLLAESKGNAPKMDGYFFQVWKLIQKLPLNGNDKNFVGIKMPWNIITVYRLSFFELI